jgi:hypothetical protein
MAHSAVGAANNHAADRDCNGWRLPKAYRVCGADGLIYQKRGWASNRKTPEDVRLAAIAIVKERARRTADEGHDAPWLSRRGHDCAPESSARHR